jgi:hypothetical protein
MSASAEFITSTVFAAIMVMIGLGAIWIVRWQTYFLLRHQSMYINQPIPSKHNFAFLCPLLTTSLTITLSTDQDLECGVVSMGASMRQVDSVELASLTQPSTGLLSANENAGLDVDGSNTTITMGFPTSSTTPANVGQKPGAGILDDHQSTKKGRFVFQSGISSCGLTRNQITDSDSAVDNHPTLASVSVPSSAASPGDVVEDSQQIGEASFRIPESAQRKTRNME